MTITLKPTASETTIQNNGSDIFTVDSTGIAMASGKTIQNASGDVLLPVSNTPAFSAKIASSQSLSETTATKLAFDTKDFDTDSAFDTSTNRFTVPAGKAGLYSISGLARIDSQLSNNLLIGIFYIYKNGANHKRSYQYYANNYIRSSGICITSLMDLAVGDYIEMYGYINSVDNTGGQVNQGIDSTFCGHRLIT
tara:strand:+ start:551 stop:1135 length:585 start_codon:yes stop_codon:yes gene_type:complete